jgi:hypothetical protein
MDLTATGPTKPLSTGILVRRCVLLIRLALPLPRLLLLRQSKVLNMLIFDVVIVMQWSVAVCPMVVYLLKHLILLLLLYLYTVFLNSSLH